MLWLALDSQGDVEVMVALPRTPAARSRRAGRLGRPRRPHRPPEAPQARPPAGRRRARALALCRLRARCLRHAGREAHRQGPARSRADAMERADPAGPGVRRTRPAPRIATCNRIRCWSTTAATPSCWAWRSSTRTRSRWPSRTLRGRRRRPAGRDRRAPHAAPGRRDRRARLRPGDAPRAGRHRAARRARRRPSVVGRLPPFGHEIVRLPWTTPHPIAEPLRAIVNRATDRQERQRYRSARTLRARAGRLAAGEPRRRTPARSRCCSDACAPSACCRRCPAAPTARARLACSKTSAPHELAERRAAGLGAVVRAGAHGQLRRSAQAGNSGSGPC